MKNITIINGPNLNLLGKREPHIYGKQTFVDYFEHLKRTFPSIQLDYFQSNIEGHIIDKLHKVGFSNTAIILNAGAYTHTSLAIADAISSINSPVIEVHISNIFDREEIRHTSLIAANCKGSVSGFGMQSYEMALYYIANHIKE
jgi:3-dehydroquinate dehydratase II